MLSKGQVCLSALRTPVDNLLFQNTNSLEPTWPTSAFKYGQPERERERRDKELDLINAIALWVGRQGSTSLESGVEKEPAALWNKERLGNKPNIKQKHACRFHQSNFCWRLHMMGSCMISPDPPECYQSLPSAFPKSRYLPLAFLWRPGDWISASTSQIPLCLQLELS